MTREMNLVATKAYVHARHELTLDEIQAAMKESQRKAKETLVVLNTYIAEGEGYGKAMRERMSEKV